MQQERQANETTTGKTAADSTEGGGKEGEKGAALIEERLSLVDRRVRMLEEADRRDLAPPCLAGSPGKTPAAPQTGAVAAHGGGAR